MKKQILRGVLAGGLCVFLASACAQPGLSAELLRDRGVPAGPALNALPQGAVVHVQLNNLLGAVEGIEQIVVPAVPVKLLPPDAQGLLQTPHPLLTVLGMQAVQEPLSEDNFAGKLGLNPRGSLGLTLYPGDPRRLWVLSLPVADRAALANALNGLLRPTLVEDISLGGGSAVRLVPHAANQIPELYVVCSDSRAYICGDRSLAQALFSSPPAQRLDHDPFLGRALTDVAGMTLNVVVNPALLRPLAFQLQQVRILGLAQLHARRAPLLAQIPPEARTQIELRLQAEWGVKDLNQFADYAEGFVAATAGQIFDFVTNQMIAFEGVSVAVDIGSASPTVRLNVYSQRFQPEKSAAAIPLADVRRAMAWLGGEPASFEVTGRQPAGAPSPGMTAWVKAIRQEFEARGLKSPFFDRLADLLAQEQPVPAVESRVPWILTTCESLEPAKPLSECKSFGEYFSELPRAFAHPVKLIPAAGLDVLQSCLEDETKVLNENRKLGQDFNEATTGRKPFLQANSRLQASDVQPHLRRFVLENAYTTPFGLFGYDQHELINRRIFAARELDGYVVLHQHGETTQWLGGLDSHAARNLPPALAKLLDRVPEGANWFAVSRTLYRLPMLVDWVAMLEDRVHTDAQAYLAQAEQVFAKTGNIDEALPELGKLPMPETVFSLNRDPATGKFYCLLPGGLAIPRPPVVPILQKLLADFAAHADEDGGLLLYRRVRPGVCEVAASQNTGALARLISSVGNRFFDEYLSQPGKLQELQTGLAAQHDWDPERYDQVLVRNPRWYFIQTPAPKRIAKVTQAIPERDAQTPAELIDLSPYYDAALTESWHAGGVANNTLANLPRGLQEFGGVKFDVRGIVQVSGQAAVQQLNVKFPKEVAGIKVGRTAHKLHFFHAVGWQSPLGTTVATYVVHYANGETREIPVAYGKDVRDWWTQASESGDDLAKPVWTGTNLAAPDNPPHGLYLTTWENPLPDVAIESLDYRSAMANSAPFLIALTVE